MMKFLRSQSQTVIVIIVGVLGLGFLFYGNSGNFLSSPGAHISNDYGRIDGTDLTVYDLTDAIRNTRYAFIMEGNAQRVTQTQIAEEAWRQLLLLREADRLHIQVSTKELADSVRSQPIFQKNGVYDPDIYKDWLSHQQVMLRVQVEPGADPLASTEAVVENVMGNTLRAQAVKSALFGTIRTSAGSVAENYEKRYGPAQISFITFDPKTFIASAQVTPDEIQAEYKSNPQKPDYRTKEKRKVDYVLFPLTPAQAKLGDADKKAAMEALGEKALNFVLTFQPEPTATGATPPAPPDFLTEAQKLGLSPVTTDFFTVDSPPTGMLPSPTFNNAAFDLTKDNPISKVIELPNGVAVIHLSEIQPSDLLPLDQVKDGIAAQLRQSKGRQAAEVAANTAANSLQATVAKGTDFKTAAAALNLKVETMPAFVPIDTPSSDQRLQAIAYTSANLTPGQVSTAIPVSEDGTSVVIHLDSRAKADPAGLAKFETNFRESQDQQLAAETYLDWADWMSKQPGTHKPPQLDAFGGVE